jgi:hypothetical protein
MATITNAGKLAVAKLLNGVDSVAAFTYMATGSGSTAEAATQTALVTENTANGSGRAAATCSYVADYKARFVNTFNFTGAVTIREIGIFNAPSAGTMLLRHVLTADKVYSNGESVEITVDVTVS